MIAGSLLEAVAALFLNGLALVAVVAGVHSAVILQTQAATEQSRSFRARQTEFLIETAATHATPVDGSPAVSAIGHNTVTLAGSRIDTGAPATRNAKPTTIAVVAATGGHRLIHRLGRQTMTLLRELPPSSRLDVLDATGAITRTPAAAVALRLQLGDVIELFAVEPGRR